MNSYDIDFKKIISLSLKVLYFQGNLHPQNDDRYPRNIYLIKAVVGVGVFFAGIFACEILNIYKSLENLEELTSALFLTMGHLNTAIKLYYLFKYNSRIDHQIERIKRPEFKPKNWYQFKILRYYIKLSQFLWCMMLMIMAIVGSIWMLRPMMAEYNMLIVPVWLPLKCDTFPMYEIIMCYQSIGLFFGGMATINVDCLIAGFILVICAQLKLLNNSVTNIRSDSEQELVHRNVPKEEYTRMLQTLMNNKLIECVLHHRYILEFRNECEDIFTISLLVQFIISILIICTTLFQITITTLSTLDLFSLILYEYFMLLEIFLICYYGNEVILESSKITTSLYHCDWVDGSSEFKSSLVIFMTRTQLSTKLYAGYFFTLSVESFLSILKSSWSYYTVLVRIND